MGYQPVARLRVSEMMGNVLIFLIGLAVYAGYGSQGFVYLMTALVLSYAAGRLIPRFRWVVWLSAAVNAVLLAGVKLQGLTGTEILSVLGISYFTLKILSYHADIYRGKIDPERNFLRYALYVTYLPQLFFGPIERYDVFSASLDNRRVDWNGISTGAARALWGLLKKFVVAARAGVIVTAISGDPDTWRGVYALTAMVLYYVQLYADFSGGIDMVIGVSRMLGMGVSENFRTPYLAESVQEFWRRWHITLGSWLRDYVYIPLGGSRKGTVRKICNTLVTFLVSGFWHGVHYLLWGLLNGILVLLGDRCKTRHGWINRLGTFTAITFLWAFFVWPDTVTALKMIASVFTDFSSGGYVGALLEMGLSAGEWTVLVFGVAGVLAYDLHQTKINAAFSGRGPAGRTAVLCALILIILVFGMYGIGFNADAFIYSRF